MWEPILVTDWAPPGSRVLARISDARAEQFWDPNHLVAQELAREMRSDQSLPEPDCCIGRGFFWDMVALFPPQVRWSQTVPPPLLFNGPVVSVGEDFEKQLRGALP